MIAGTDSAESVRRGRLADLCVLTMGLQLLVETANMGGLSGIKKQQEQDTHPAHQLRNTYFQQMVHRNGCIEISCIWGWCQKGESPRRPRAASFHYFSECQTLAAFSERR